MAVMELVPQNDKRLGLLEILRFVEEHVQGKAGCLGSGVFEAVDGTQRILYVERWGSVKELCAHIKSELYFPILSAMELASEKPRISFHEVSQTRSMELIEELRNSRAESKSMAADDTT